MPAEKPAFSFMNLHLDNQTCQVLIPARFKKCDIIMFYLDISA